MQTLDKAMTAEMTPGSARVLGGRDLYMEIIENATGAIWMALKPATKEDLLSLDLGDEFTPIGVGHASMDAAAFLHSPNLEGEAVHERLISGWRFVSNAEPPREIPPGTGDDEITRFMVNKAHLLGFEAGRKVSILCLPEGNFVECVGYPENDDNLTLPEGGRLEKLTLSEPWVVRLPTPTTTLWWGFGSGRTRSFQGPIDSLPPKS